MRWAVIIAVAALLVACEEDIAGQATSGAPSNEPQRLLFDKSDKGDLQQSASFDVPKSGRIELCWELSGVGPGGSKPHVSSIYIVPEGKIAGQGAGSVAAQSGTKEQNGCTYATVQKGRYYLKVIATSWTEWRAKVYTA